MLPQVLARLKLIRWDVRKNEHLSYGASAEAICSANGPRSFLIRLCFAKFHRGGSLALASRGDWLAIAVPKLWHEHLF